MLNLELPVFCLFNVINRLIDDMLIAMLIAQRSGLKLVAAFVSVYVSTASVFIVVTFCELYKYTDTRYILIKWFTILFFIDYFIRAHFILLSVLYALTAFELRKLILLLKDYCLAGVGNNWGRSLSRTAEFCWLFCRGKLVCLCIQNRIVHSGRSLHVQDRLFIPALCN